MALELEDLSAAIQVPDAHQAISQPGGQSRAVGAAGQTNDQLSLRKPFTTGPSTPKLDSAVRASSGQQTSIRAELNHTRGRGEIRVTESFREGMPLDVE